MKRFACWAALAAALLVTRAQAGCVHVENQDLIEWSCEGGSVEDLKAIPDNAEKIRIQNMPVNRLTESLLSRFGRNLVVLTCTHCMITDIEDNAFRRLENLQQLSLDNNHLKEVRGAWFEGLTYLTYLDLNYNNIERVDGDVFRNTPELVDLRVSGNRLTCLDIESISQLKDLKRIFLNENPSFACPNAVRRFLTSRKIDFEADPHWETMTQDRVQANSPVPYAPPVPTEQELREPVPTTPPTYYTRPPWVPSTQPPTPEPTTVPPPPPTPPRRPYVPEMIQPSVPEQDFSFQTPYYAPKVNQQQLDEYRNTAAQQARNVTDAAIDKAAAVAVNATVPSIAADQSADPATTTECPNAAVSLARETLLLGLGLLALPAYRWTAEIL